MDLLVAGVSLPIFMPATEHGGDLYLDSVWIKDANLLEAVRRGCDELWLVWCIGNTATYRDGAFKQYVHMIEISANGSLNEELERIRALGEERGRPVRVHVIRPEWPLPLDPDFYMGRIDAGTLIALGYRDACRYLETRDPAGVPLGPEATRMREPRPGVGWRSELRGRADGGELTVHAHAEVEDVAAFTGGAPAVAVGEVSHPDLGDRVLARDGSVSLEGGRLRWTVDVDGRRFSLEQDARRALGTAHSLHARGVASPLDGARAVGRFVGALARGRRAD
jgi:hypothetical protein